MSSRRGFRKGRGNADTRRTHMACLSWRGKDQNVLLFHKIERPVSKPMHSKTDRYFSHADTYPEDLEPCGRSGITGRTGVAASASRRLLIGFLLVGCAFGQVGQTTVNLATQGRNVDFSTFPFTRPIAVGAALPATCQVGQLFFNSAATPGANLYGCTGVNLWTVLSGSNSTPTVALAPNSLSFGSQNVGTSTPKTVTLTNTGISYLAVTGITLTGTNASDFVISNTCGSTVASGASCTTPHA